MEKKGFIIQNVGHPFPNRQAARNLGLISLSIFLSLGIAFLIPKPHKFTFMLMVFFVAIFVSVVLVLLNHEEKSEKKMGKLLIEDGKLIFPDYLMAPSPYLKHKAPMESEFEVENITHFKIINGNGRHFVYRTPFFRVGLRGEGKRYRYIFNTLNFAQEQLLYDQLRQSSNHPEREEIFKFATRHI